MLKSKVGYSTNLDSFMSGFESAEKSTKDLKNPKVSFLFASCKNNLKQVVKGIKSVTDTPIIGCTSSGGIIVPDGIIRSKEGYSGLLTLSDENLTVGVACHEAGKNPRSIGRKVAVDAVRNAKTTRAPAYFYMVTSPKEEEEYLLGIQDVIGRVPMFGGSAADDEITEEWKIICNDKIISDGVAVAFFYTDNEIVTSFSGKYNETNNVGIITKVEEERTLAEINGSSALRIYAQWISTSPSQLKGEGLLEAAITKPLGVKAVQGNLTLIKQPMFVEDMGTKTVMDDKITLGNKVMEKTAIIQLETTVDEMIEANKVMLKELKTKLYTAAGAYILINSAGRKKVLKERLDEVYQKILEETGGVPFIMPFTYGQFGYEEHSANCCGGLMMSFTVFGIN